MKLLKVVFSLFAVLIFAIPSYAAIGRAVIKGTVKDSAVLGSVSIMEMNDGLQIEASVANVSAGKHGFHVHEKGDCGDEGKAAGGHFNPQKVAHGFMPKDGQMHAHTGDMGNIEAGADGKGKLSIFLPGVHLIAKDPSVAGLAVILHEKEDDFGQPTGNAGGRIGCGIIMIEDEGAASANASDDLTNSGGEGG